MRLRQVTEFILSVEMGRESVDRRFALRSALAVQARSIPGVSVTVHEGGQFRQRSVPIDLFLASATLGAAYHLLLLARDSVRRNGMAASVRHEDLPTLELAICDDQDIRDWLRRIKWEESQG